MKPFAAAGISLRLAIAWTAATIIMLLVISALILVQPHFALNLGVIRTTGRAGLLATLLPALAGMAGILLFFSATLRKGALLLVCYSGFWAAVMASGLPAVWNARRSFCLKGLNFCIISPWVARLTVLGIVLPFLLAGFVFLVAARAWSDDSAITPEVHRGMRNHAR